MKSWSGNSPIRYGLTLETSITVPRTMVVMKIAAPAKVLHDKNRGMQYQYKIVQGTVSVFINDHNVKFLS